MGPSFSLPVYPLHPKELLRASTSQRLREARSIWAYLDDRAVALAGHLGPAADVSAGAVDLAFDLHGSPYSVLYGLVDAIAAVRGSGALLREEVVLGLPVGLVRARDPYPRARLALPGKYPPIGWIKVAILDGCEREAPVLAAFARPSDIRLVRRARASLTPGQVDRVRAFKRKLGWVVKFDWREFVCSLERDARCGYEIMVWENVAEVYESECALRGGIADAERRLLVAVLIVATTTGFSVEGVLSSFPSAKAVPDVARAITRLQELMERPADG